MAIVIDFKMEQFVLVPAAVYINSLITHSITNMNSKNNKVNKIPCTKLTQWKKINKKLLAKVAIIFILDKPFSCPRTEFFYQTLFLWMVWKLECCCQILLLNSVQYVENAEVPEI